MVKQIDEVFYKLDKYEQEQIEYLKANKPVLQVVFRHVSKSGMLRKFDVYYIRNNELVYLNWLYSAFDLRKRDKQGQIIQRGCGMDMAFDLAYSLSWRLFAGQDNAGYILKHRLI